MIDESRPSRSRVEPGAFFVVVTVFAVLAAALLPTSAEAQEAYARRDYSTPGLIVETGGRTGSCDVFFFAPGRKGTPGEYLLASGDDKVVRSWKYQGGKLLTSDIEPLRWAVYREHRGQIYAMALSPDKKYVAVAGHGITNSITAAVIDRFSGEIQYGLQSKERGTVWSIAFSPDGKQIALGGDDGKVWLWNLDRKKSEVLDYVGRHELLTDSDFNYVRLVAYLDAKRLISLDEQGQLIRWKLSPHGTVASKQPLFRFQTQNGMRKLSDIALSPNKQWIAAAVEDTRVEVRSVPGGKLKHIPLGFGELPHRVAFDADSSKLAVGIRVVDQQAPFFRVSGHHVEIWDLKPAAPKKLPVIVRPSYIPEGVAFHPNGRYLAVAGGDDHEVTLWDLGDGQGQAVRTSFMPGKGNCIWGISLSADGRDVAFQTARHPKMPHPNYRGAGRWKVFDLLKRDWKPDSQKPLSQPLHAWGGWKLHTMRPDGVVIYHWNGADWVRYQRPPPKKDIYVWYVQSPAGKVYQLPMDRFREGPPNCYTFLPAIRNHPIRLVVGHYWGASVFSLTNRGPERTQLLYGHGDDVIALAVSEDQTQLVTASLDKTIAGWSLEGWPYQPQLGADFIDDKQGNLYVNEVAAGSPAWEAGLSHKDRIALLVVNKKIIHNPLGLFKQPKIENVQGALKHLQNPEPGKELFFYWYPKDSAKGRYQATTLKQRPIWRFFPAGDREWVLWRWRDHYYDTSTHGDKYIGWQRSFKDISKSPSFYPAEQLRDVFQRPDHIKETMKQWVSAPGQNPEEVSFPKYEPPRVEIRGAAEYVVKNNNLQLDLFAVPKNELIESQQLNKVILWINDYQAEVWPRVGAPLNPALFAEQYAVPRDKLRRGKNRLLLQCYNRAGSRGESRIIEVNYDLPPVNPNLHGLFIGIGDYSNGVITRRLPSGKLVPDRPDNLQCDQDIRILADIWRAQQGKRYNQVKLNILPELQCTSANILKELDNLQNNKMLRPDDLLVFHLAGHGVRTGDLKEHVPPQQLKGLGDYLFCCVDVNFNNLRNTTIDFEKLYERLIKLPCHKLILLDTCHAGALKIEMEMDSKVNPIRLLTKDGVGPIILAACEPKQSALEHPGIDFGGAFGLFNIALRKTLENPRDFTQADQDGNKRLDAVEIARSVKSLVERYVDQLRKLNVQNLENQAPMAFVPALEEELVIAAK